ncbi:uncharacterized protein JCM15063_000288 [Sporobolomyces koalae]|uniref:uncharacterized protein n=1 Tax=Sporobolomyces koalae TaxID=500713 RepID=UPI00317187AE
MLKRLSGTFSQSSDQLLVPPPLGSPNLAFASSAPSSPRQLYPSTSPRHQSFPFPDTTPARVLDRQTLHKSLKLLSNVLVALDDLRQATLVQSKAEKHLAKGLKELAVEAWGDKSPNSSRDNHIAEALLASASMYEALAENESKLAKLVQIDYEAVNELASKYFKKTAKEEKAYEESLALVDHKMSKATLAYNKQATASATTGTRPATHSQLESLTQSHSTYIQTLHALQSQAALVQQTYAEQISTKRDRVGRHFATCFVGLADKTWRNRIESVKKGGQTIGNVLNCGVWVAEGIENVHTLNSRLQQGDEDVSRGRDDRDRIGLVRGARAPSASTRTTSFDTARSMTSSSVSLQQSYNDLASSRAGISTTPEPFLSDSELRSEPLPPSPRNVKAQSPISSSLTTDTRLPEREEEAAEDDQGLGGGRTLPRGWYLDPSFATGGSPVLQPEHESGPRLGDPEEHDFSTNTIRSSQPRSQQRSSLDALRRTDDAPLSTEDMHRSSADPVRRPTPRYGSAPPLASMESARHTEAGVDEWGRPSQEDGGSFVRRMSQKYGKQAETLEQVRRPVPQESRPQQEPHHDRSNSRVSLLAKRYSEPLPPAHDVSRSNATSPRRPLPEPSQRLSTSSSFDMGTSPAARPGYSNRHQSSPNFATLSPLDDLPAKLRSSSSSSSHESHPSFCACSTCTTRHYSSAGKMTMTRQQEEQLQKDLRTSPKGGTLKGLVAKGKEVFHAA